MDRIQDFPTTSNGAELQSHLLNDLRQSSLPAPPAQGSKVTHNPQTSIGDEHQELTRRGSLQRIQVDFPIVVWHVVTKAT